MMSGASWLPQADEEMHDQGLLHIEQMVQRLARESCPEGACPIEPVIQQCVHQVVSGLWRTSRISRYVPVLALKHVQDCIRAGTCDVEGQP